MPSSQRSSHASETCRLEWRPSAQLAGVMQLGGGAAGIAVLASALPPVAGGLLAAAAVIGGWHAAWRERSRPLRQIVWDGHAGLLRVDGVVVDAPHLAWRGALASLSWRDAEGRRQRLQFWPDVLDAGKRRELRLAAGPVAASPAPASVAP
jgi:toxin CptA